MPSAAAVFALLISQESATAVRAGESWWRHSVDSTVMFLKSPILISTDWGSQVNDFHVRVSAEGLERPSAQTRTHQWRGVRTTHLSMQHSTTLWYSPER